MNYLLGYVVVAIMSTGDLMPLRNDIGANVYKTEIECIEHARKATDLGQPSQCITIYGRR